MGGKAQNLLKMKGLGLNVPDFIVFSETEYSNLSEVELINLIDKKLKGNYFSVRSSANLEDDINTSFAGQFITKLFVNKQNLLANIKEVANSKYSDNIKSYLQINDLNLDDIHMSIIIQEMIDADISGVAFSRNPLKPYKDERMISSVYGLGEGLVGGNLVSDIFIIDSNNIVSSTIIEKKRQLKFSDFQLKYIKVNEKKANLPTLNHKQINEINENLTFIEEKFNCPQDVEFCFKDNILFFLQTRPITTIDYKAEHIIWDNSNIIESYPGITLPFTFSFILGIYESVYKNFGFILGVPKYQIEANKEVFSQMLGHIKGRVYYHLINWYKALAMLPAYSINSKFMEKMMGVKEPLGVKFKLNKTPNKFFSYFLMIKTFFTLLKINHNLPKEKKHFTVKTNKIISKYKNEDYSSFALNDIWDKYFAFKNMLVNDWTPPLANDLFVMIYFGTLEKLCTNWLKKPGLHNELVIGKYYLKSVLPSELVNEIINTAIEENQFEILKNEKENIILQKCKQNSLGKTGQLILEYIELYGDRSVGELKLENETFTQNPEKFISILKSYKGKINTVKQISTSDYSNYINQLPLLKKNIFKYILKKAAENS